MIIESKRDYTVYLEMLLDYKIANDPSVMENQRQFSGETQFVRQHSKSKVTEKIDALF